MKKTFTFLIAALALLTFFAVPLGMRGQNTYTISLLDNGSNSDGSSNIGYVSHANVPKNVSVSDNLDYVNTINTGATFKASTGNGWKLSSSSGTGNFTLNLTTDAQALTVSKVTINAKNYSNDETTLTVTITKVDNTTQSQSFSSLASSFTDYDLTLTSASTIKSIQVQANANKRRAYVHHITVTIPSTGPTQLGTPDNFAATPSNGEATFTWDAVENASSYTISYTPDGGEEATVTGITGTSRTITGLTNGTEYTCKIKAVGNGSNYSDSEYSSLITVTPTNATFYNINIASSITGGSVTASPVSAIAGATITLTATPSDAYTFTNIASNWSISLAVTVTPGENNTATFEMPASDVSVSATFNAKPTFEVACVANPVAGGTIEASPASAYEGQTVTLSCTTYTGYSLTGVVITKTSNGSATGITPTASGDNFVFTMPDYAVTVTATFKPVYVSGGSFQKHTGDLEEGYYVITYNTYTMKNTISSSRFTNGVSITNGANIIENIDKNIVWYIAKDGDYWTLYNEDVNKFAAGTNSNNQGALVDDVADLARWIVTKDNNGKFEFENYGRTTQTNKWLHNNGTSGWACYSPSTGGAVTLYKYFNANRQLSSIAVSGQTTYYIVGDAFSFDGVCTATYDDESTCVVTPTSVSTPDMTTAGSKTITVTYTEKEVTKTTTYSISVVENPYVTTTLEGDDMAAMTNAGNGYNVNKTVTTSDGFLWETNGYQTTSITNMIQLRNRTDSNGVSYIKLPEVDGAIKKLTFAVTGSSAENSSGLTTSNKLYFQQSNTKNEAIIAEGGGSSTNEIVIDLINTFYSQGYITASGSLRVWSISMEYLPYSDLEGTSLSSVEGNSAIAIPANVSATASNITIPVNSGIVVRSGATLTVSGTLTNNGDASNLIIEDGGQLIAANRVQATVKKTIAAYTGDHDGWNFIASPVTTELVTNNIDGLIPTSNSIIYDLYKYNEPNTMWYTYKSSGSGAPGFSIKPNEGYLYAHSTGTTINFVGTVEKADDEINIADLSVTESAGNLKGFHLVGNPFPCNAYTDRSYYVLSYDQSEDRTILAEYSASQNEPIPPCTGVMVEVTSDNNDVNFASSSYSIMAKGNVKINLEQQVVNRSGVTTTTVDKAIVSFTEGDELTKFVLNEENAKLYISQNGKDYAIVSAGAQGEMPVNFKAAVDGQYTLTVNPDDVVMNYLHLIDNLTGADVDLLAQPSYSFTAKSTDYASRFKLAFATSSSTLDDDFAFVSNDHLMIYGIEGDAILKVMDLTGRTLSTESFNGSYDKALNLSTGVYMLQLIQGAEVRTQKIIL